MVEAAPVAGQVQAVAAVMEAVPQGVAAGVQVRVVEVAAAPALAPAAGQAAALEQARAPAGARGPEAAPELQGVPDATVWAPDPVPATVPVQDPVRRWVPVSVPAPMHRSVLVRLRLSAPAQMLRWALGRMLRQPQRPHPASGLGQDRPPAMGPVMEPAIRELDLKTAQVLGPLHSVRHM